MDLSCKLSPILVREMFGTIGTDIPSRTDHYCADFIMLQSRLPSYKSFQYGNDKGKSLARACHSFYNNVSVLHEKGYSGGLNRCHLCVSH